MPPAPFRDKIKHRRGFAAIIGVVLISGIALISSIALAANYIIESRETTNRAYAIQARSSAYACANIAMLRLKKNRSYTGNENISVDKVICTIEPVVSNSNARTVYAKATVNGYASRIMVQIDDVDQLYVSSWNEVPPT
jgi:transcriptional regulator CtsR